MVLWKFKIVTSVSINHRKHLYTQTSKGEKGVELHFCILNNFNSSDRLYPSCQHSALFLPYIPHYCVNRVNINITCRMNWLESYFVAKKITIIAIIGSQSSFCQNYFRNQYDWRRPGISVSYFIRSS